MNVLKSELRYSNPFMNVKAANEGESTDFTHFNLKIGCHDNVLERSIKDGQISNPRSNTYHKW